MGDRLVHGGQPIMKVLILTGPRDGQLTDHDRPILELMAPPHPLDDYVTVLRYKRATFCDGEKYVRLFVPTEWPDQAMQGKVLNHLINRAFKDAAK